MTPATTAPSRAEAGRGRRERGSVSLEFAIIMGALIVGFFSLLIVAGRIMQQENDVRSAANAAARAASLRDTYQDALTDARAVGAANLTDSGVSCEDQRITIVTPAADFGPGGVVTVRVECTARSIASIGFPANLYWYQATEVIDGFRGRP
jgi:Flp pilus assembly protein TadG